MEQVINDPQTNKVTTTEDLNKREAELNKFKADLIEVYNKLKGERNLAVKLKQYGIETPEQIENLFSKNLKTEPEKQTSNPETGLSESAPYDKENEKDERIKQLESEMEDMRDFILRQDTNTRTDKILSQIKQETANNKDFPLLSRVADENIAYNILNQIERDKQVGKNLPFADYLKATENNLKMFNEKLNPVNVNQNTGTGPFSQAPASAPAPAPAQIDNSAQKKTSQDPDGFPSLPPSTSALETSGGNEAQKEMLNKGRNPYTGKVDIDKAFEADLSDFISGGERE